MRIKHIWTVFKKEVKDLTRDKRTIITSILLPMLLIPAINIIMGGSAEKFTKDINENVTIALSRNSDTAEARQLVRERLIAPNPSLVLVNSANPEEDLKGEKIRCILEVEPDFRDKLEKGEPFTINLKYDQSKTKSEASVQIVSGAIEEFRESVIRDRIAALGLNQNILKPVILEKTNVSTNQKGSNLILMMMLPMMIGILVSVGGIPAATDLVAGEKERNTFEPLLTTMPGRGSLLLGKYFAVTLFSFISVVAIVAGLVLGYFLNPNSLTMGMDSQISGFDIQPLAIALAIIITVALGMMFSGVQIALSAFAKSYKEAQTYMSFLMIVAMVPGYATMFMQAGDLRAYMFAVPVLNTISAFKMIFGGVISYTNLVIALVTSLLFVALTLWMAASLFKKEKILFRS